MNRREAVEAAVVVAVGAPLAGAQQAPPYNPWAEHVTALRRATTTVDGLSYQLGVALENGNAQAGSTLQGRLYLALDRQRDVVNEIFAFLGSQGPAQQVRRPR